MAVSTLSRPSRAVRQWAAATCLVWTGCGVTQQAAQGADEATGPQVTRHSQAAHAPASVPKVIFRQRFTNPQATGVEAVPADGALIHGQGIHDTNSSVPGKAYWCEIDLPPEKAVRIVVTMPKTDWSGLHYRFCLRINGGDPIVQATAPLELRINQAGGIGDSIFSAVPIEYPVVRDSTWLAATTADVLRKHSQNVYRGWVRYEGNTANAFLRRFDGRKIGEPAERLVEIHLLNSGPKPQRVRAEVADIEATRVDPLANPSMIQLLNAKSPFITATRSEILRARERVGNGTEMPAALLADLRLATKVVSQPVSVIRKQAAWPASEICRADGCGEPLKPSPPEGYRCPKCGLLHDNERFQGLLVYEHHRLNGEAVRALGFAWQGYDDPRYRDKAEEILLAYAEAIPDFSLGHNWLGDCWLFDEFLNGYDFIRDSLSAESRNTIEQGFLMPMVRRIHHYNHHYPEGYVVLWRTCLLAAILCQNADWINYLVLSPTGNQEVVIRHGLTADFISLKGAAYHGDILRSIGEAGQALENCGHHFFDERVRQLYDAVPKQIMPDHTLPALGHANIGMKAAGYGFETAFRYYRDPIYLALTAPAFLDSPGTRIFWADPDLPEVADLRMPSTNLIASGLTVLRTQDNSAAVAIGWGAPKRNDPARLDFEYFAAGGPLVWSSGITGYANPLFAPWYQQSLSRNGLVVDGQTQREVAASLLFSDLESPDQAAVYELQDGYPGTRWVRGFVHLQDGGLIVLDRLWADRPTTCDWVCHMPGEVAISGPQPRPHGPLGLHHGYELLTNIGVVKSGPQPTSFAVMQSVGGVRRGVTISATASVPADFFLAKGFTGHDARPSQLVLQRVVQTTDVAYAALFEPFTGKPPPAGFVRLSAVENGSITVSCRRGSQRHAVELRGLDDPNSPDAVSLRVTQQSSLD